MYNLYMDTQQNFIRPKKLHEQVAERLKAAILDHTYMPGDKLPSERELMATYGIGRPAIREALLLLERSGLVALRSGSPATVTRADAKIFIREMGDAVEHFLNDPQGVKELQAARRLLECSLVRNAAPLCTDEDIAHMQAILERSRLSLNDIATFESLDLEFHFAIVKITGSSVFEVVFKALNEWLRDQRTVNFSVPGQTIISLASHQAICDALATHNPDLAEEAMKEHLMHVEQTYWTAKTAASQHATPQKNKKGTVPPLPK